MTNISSIYDMDAFKPVLLDERDNLLLFSRSKCSLSLSVSKNFLLEMQSTHPNSFEYPLHGLGFVT